MAEKPEIHQNQPELAVLSGDAYNRKDFAVLNDSEFTELLSSIEGIGIDEFFSLYEELKTQIIPGTLDIAFSTTGGGNVFALIEEAINALRREEFDVYRARMIVLHSKINALTVALDNPTPKSHAYLVKWSSQFVTELNTRFKAVFDYIVELMKENADLRAELEALRRENEELKKQIIQLNDLIIKLTAPESSGFQIIPDVFTVDTVGPTWVAGETVEITVCGSARYEFAAGKGFEGMFLWEQIPETSRWRIRTAEQLVGKTAYITATALDAPSRTTARPTEQIVFVFPGAIIPPEPSILRSSLGNDIVLYVPGRGPAGEDTDMETFNRLGYRSYLETVISNGIGPYTYTNNVGNNETAFYSVEGLFDNVNNTVRVGLNGNRVGVSPTALTIRDSTGNSLTIKITVTAVYVPASSPISDVSISPESIGIDIPGSVVAAYITHDSSTLPKISQIGTSAGKPANYRIVRGVNYTQNGNTTIEEIQVEMRGQGFYNMMVTGGPDTQTFTDNTGVIHRGAAPFFISLGIVQE